MKHLAILAAVLVGLSAPLGVAAQESLVAKCNLQLVELSGAGDACIAAAQAVVSAQPALGILLAGGNPTIGSSGAAGLRLGVIPRLSAGLRLNTVAIRIPDLLTEQVDGQLGAISRRYGAPAPAVTADLSVGLTDGFGFIPGIGGIGGISLLGSASYLPFSLVTDGFDNPNLAYGLGARLHLLNESFIAPGVSLSLMRKKLGSVSFGDVCPGGIVAAQVSVGPDGNTTFGECAGPGDVGEFAFDLTDWTARLVASKHVLGFGATLGMGHDRYTSDLAFGFRGDELLPATEFTPVFRVSDALLRSRQWSVFGNLSYSLLVTTFALEVGWQQGTSPITGFQDLGSEFDPRDGVWFGSLGARVGL